MPAVLMHYFENTERYTKIPLAWSERYLNFDLIYWTKSDSIDLLRKSKNVQILDLKHIQKNIGSSFSLWDEEVTPQEDEGAFK